MAAVTVETWFASARERRLWAATAAIVVAIYSTLGLARTLAGALRSRGLLDLGFGIAVVLVVAAVVALGLQSRSGGVEIGVAAGIAAAYLLVFVRMGIAEERTHLIEYGVLAAFLHAALSERSRRGRPVPRPALLAVAAASLLGVVDEAIQAVLPSRVFDPIDIGFNVLASVMAVTAAVALGWARRRRRKGSSPTGG